MPRRLQHGARHLALLYRAVGQLGHLRQHNAGSAPSAGDGVSHCPSFVSIITLPAAAEAMRPH